MTGVLTGSPTLILFLLFQVAELVTSEFFEQGDRERSELKLTPSVSTSHHLCFCESCCLASVRKRKFSAWLLHCLAAVLKAAADLCSHSPQHVGCISPDLNFSHVDIKTVLAGKDFGLNEDNAFTLSYKATATQKRSTMCLTEGLWRLILKGGKNQQVSASQLLAVD